MTESARYYGIYRGTVSNNVDPMKMGRILPIATDVGGLPPCSWAMPCVPVAGLQTGAFMVPPIGSGVWIQFEGGDPDRPVWIGGYWGSAPEVPALAQLAQLPVMSIVLQTLLQNSLVISDLPGPAGGIILKTNTGAVISLTATGIVISNGLATIALTGPTVSINGTALVIT
jgi:hypothetical protein